MHHQRQAHAIRFFCLLAVMVSVLATPFMPNRAHTAAAYGDGLGTSNSALCYFPGTALSGSAEDGSGGVPTIPGEHCPLCLIGTAAALPCSGVSYAPPQHIGHAASHLPFDPSGRLRPTPLTGSAGARAPPFFA